MAKLVDANGTVVADDLSTEEVEALSARGVRLDLPDADEEDEPEKPPEQEALEEQYDVEIEEIDSIDARERMRWVQLQKRLDEYDTEIEKRQRERDERIDPTYRSNPAEEVRSTAVDRGLIEELQDGFAQLVTRPTPRPAESGPRLDSENVVRRAAGDVTIERLFEEERIVETGDRCVGICTDMSGSVGSDMEEIKLASACIAKATEIIGDEFLMEGFTSQRDSSRQDKSELDLRIITGPDEEFEWDHLDSFESDGGTPTAAGIRDTRTLMEEVDAREHIMIVITDGKAIVTEDGYKTQDNKPVEQARRAVDECRDDGYEVIGLGFGSISNGKMAETFGDGNFKLTTIDSITDDIIELYRSRMKVAR